MTDIINAFLSAQTTAEVDRIVKANIETINACPRLLSFARGARKRIIHLQRMNLKYTEIIYKN
jgi:hypothetical protein